MAKRSQTDAALAAPESPSKNLKKSGNSRAKKRSSLGETSNSTPKKVRKSAKVVNEPSHVNSPPASPGDALLTEQDELVERASYSPVGKDADKVSITPKKKASRKSSKSSESLVPAENKGVLDSAMKKSRKSLK